nr:MAG TPA: hypothetical protein [Caudoviricetes sp.]
MSGCMTDQSTMQPLPIKRQSYYIMAACKKKG